MTKKIILFIIAFPIGLQVYSQNNAIGFKLGDPYGISFKHYISNHALEINLGRSGWFYGHKYYNNRFDYWYKKNKNQYAAIYYYGYAAKPPISLQLRYLFQKDISEMEGLQWYFGFGLQMRFARIHYYYDYKVPGDPYWYSNVDDVIDFDAGVDGILGIEYKFKDVPLSCFADCNLFLEIFDHPFYPYFQPGLGLRFHF